MLPLNKILLPVDFSERSIGAGRYAAALARSGTEILVLHVLEPLRYELTALDFGGTMMNGLAVERKAMAERELEMFLKEELAGCNVRRVLAEGDPAREVVAFAHQEKVNLIAMPTHGYGPFRRFILGSVTAKVLHDADCPVLTGVHIEQAGGPRQIEFHNVVCAVDLGPQSRRAFCWAAETAREFSARLTLMHAAPSIEASHGEYFDATLPAEIGQAAREELETLRSAVGAEADVIVERGDAPRAVCATAERLGADLLVIGRGSAAGVFGRLRTNAYAIIRQSPCPVVSV
jgi:nucleotide-binding universal stress UspA family protein